LCLRDKLTTHAQKSGIIIPSDDGLLAETADFYDRLGTRLGKKTGLAAGTGHLAHARAI
jgi:hypothetical protein